MNHLFLLRKVLPDHIIFEVFEDILIFKIKLFAFQLLPNSYAFSNTQVKKLLIFSEEATLSFQRYAQLIS